MRSQGRLVKVENGVRRASVPLARGCDAVLGSGDVLTRLAEKEHAEAVRAAGGPVRYARSVRQATKVVRRESVSAEVAASVPPVSRPSQLPAARREVFGREFQFTQLDVVLGELGRATK